MTTTTEPVIRWLIRSDMDEVLSIDRRSFRPAWSEEDFFAMLRERNCIGVVAEAEHMDIAGFCLYTLERRSLRICRMAVDPLYRRRGFGRAFMNRLGAKLSQQKRRYVVAESHVAAVATNKFFASCGFRAIGCNGDIFEFRLSVNRDDQKDL